MTEPPKRVPRLAVVETVERLTPRMVRVVFGGDGLDGFAAGAFTDHYVKLQLPPPGAPYGAPFDVEDVRARLAREHWPRTRTYTVRAWDPDRRRLTIDFVVHGSEGVAGPWAANAAPGDRLQLLGPGGGYAPDPTADWHLMVGDASVVPAISASLERVPAGVPVHVLVQVDDAGERQPLRTPGALHEQWPTDDDALLAALRALEVPAGRVHAFVHGEAEAVRAVRRHLLGERGIDPADVSMSGYWKRARTEEGWREEKAAWARQVEQDLGRARLDARADA